MNSIGTIYRLTSFGESHGFAIGGVVDGCPAGLVLDITAIQEELNRRRPGQSSMTSQRRENDKLEILSGLFKGTTTGAPIAFFVTNTDAQPADYDSLKELYRPGHADYTYLAKYGTRDYRGGGRASARETIARIIAGAIAKQVLTLKGITIQAYTSQIGTVTEDRPYTMLDLTQTEQHSIRTPDPEKAEQMEQAVFEAQAKGDSLGGIVTCVTKGMPAGIGEPVFDKLQAALAAAMLSIPAAKGFDYGSGFEAATMHGSLHNDPFISEHNQIVTQTNHAGGILGGISTGADIYFRVAFKPTSSIDQEQQTVDYKGSPQTIRVQGRHDACFVPRAVPIVEAMTAIVLLDNYLLRQANRLLEE